MTHEDALHASRSIMKRALWQIALYGKNDEDRRVAEAALAEQARIYRDGVLQATD